MSLGYLVGNSNVVELRHLRNNETGEFDSTANVSVTLQTTGGVDVAGHTWPLAMTHDKSGTYRVVLTSSLAVVAGEEYVQTIDAVGAGGLTARFISTVRATDRIA